MKTPMKTSIYLPMAAILLTAALAGPAVAEEKLVPFSGSLQGGETGVFQPPGTLLVDGSGGGIATQLGRFTATWKATVNLLDKPISGNGSFHFIAANGDSIFTTHVGQAEPTDKPGQFRIREFNTITGGTGRFTGAKGSFTLERLSDETTTGGSFHGWITSPGAAN